MIPAARRSFRILVIDDNEAIHNDLKKILLPSSDTSGLDEDEALLFGSSVENKFDFLIDSAFQGQEGLSMVEAASKTDDPYALAFVDVRMPPGWDGVETIAHLWECDRHLQVVICTAHSDYNWHDITDQLGLSPNLVILKKPFDPIEVTQLAHALTSKWWSEEATRRQVEALDQLVERRTAELISTVSELEQAKRKAEADALEDSLTTLPNRRLFMRRLEDALQRAKVQPRYQCAVLYLDVDRFKLVNDSLGHIVGDEMLVEIATRLRSWLREGFGAISGEDLVARIGGDEFAILLSGIRAAEDAVKVAERLKYALSKPLKVRGKEVSCSASIGIVTSDSVCVDAEGMMRDADTAMYRAKNAGGGSWVLFDASMHHSNLERLHKESEIRQGLDRGEFYLVYQPIMSLKTGRFEGTEALARWKSPSRGLVSPADFIPLAEETGLIVPIGVWSINEACRQAKEWYRHWGPDSTPAISVNISARQFLQPDLVQMVEKAIRKWGIESRSIRIELTETATMHDPERAIVMFRQLQEIGVRLSIDDFGTGYSSLNYLHSFPIDTLKIDQSFVGNMESDERSLAIVRTIINLAHNLSMGVIAEGVETAGQLRILWGFGCDFVQGYHLAYPLTADECSKIIAPSQGNEIPKQQIPDLRYSDVSDMSHC